MADSLESIGGVPVFVCGAEGEVVANDRDAVDLIAGAYSVEASWVLVPVERLEPDFFVLRSGVAGQVLGKFADYRMGLVVVGDVSGWVAESDALRDLLRESNRGRQAWFVADRAEAEGRLAAVGAALNR
ncbi:DUF4180 domain-containing protein [Phytomonospora endophytica]|uniref:DUF4180 domain-containing protein n=1 Tax=Phytomonospora endophytica TaxID=714109 RepID=A0A841FP46_9ACTN|nr:DUF4180 domain-containing protein [Phytomonospora endophytica]MBB6033720.1 hypothetical protein [Phytomonospora endophytica]GIG64762.1 hypothetical protein Pen01_10570 [Phytomonospora endophytica]